MTNIYDKKTRKLLHYILIFFWLLMLAQCEDNNTVNNVLESLLIPPMCGLKLICVITKSNLGQLKKSSFMQGLNFLESIISSDSKVNLIKETLETGKKGGNCSSLAPLCSYSDADLLLTSRKLFSSSSHSVSSSGLLRKRISRRTKRHIEPALDFVIRPLVRSEDLSEDKKKVCKKCDKRSVSCTVFNVGRR